MAVILTALRSGLRRQWRAWLSLALLVGLFAGAVLAAAAGARRTATAYPRLLAHAAAGDVFITPFERRLRGSYEEIRRLPHVADAGLAGVPVMARVDPSGAGDFLLFPMASADGRFGYTVNRPKLLAGRLPHPDRADQALLDPATARRFRVGVGDQLVLRAFDREPADRSRIAPSDGTPVNFSIVGIGVFVDQVVPTQFFEGLPRLFLSPAAYRVYAAGPESVVFEEIFVRLKPGTDVGGFRAEVERITAGDPEAAGHDFGSDADRTAKVQRAIGPQATALALFAALASIAGLLIVGQSIARQVLLESSDHPILRALGMTRGQLVATAALRVAGTGLLGGLLGALLAVASSPLMPIGPARLAEPRLGLSVNVALLAAGTGALVVLLVAVAAGPIWRSATPTGAFGSAEFPGAQRSSRLAGAVARAGAAPTVVVGTRLALEPGHGRTALPTRSTLAGTVMALTAVVASLIFGANLDRLVSDPARYGQAWDVAVDSGYSLLPTRATVTRLAGDPAVAGFSGANLGEIAIGGRQVPAVGIDRLRGSVFPTLLEGRPPSRPDEIVLGTDVLARTRRTVGERITVEIGGSPRDMRIVGRAVFPALGLPGLSPAGLGEGAAVTGDVLPPPSLDAESPEDTYNMFLVRFRPHARDDAVARLERDVRQPDGPFGPPCQTNDGACLVRSHRPGDIGNYARVRATPLVLAGLLALIGMGTLANALASAVRRRRRDLATLRALGFVRRQAAATVAWQATTVALVSVVVGLPLGVVVGRSVWMAFAERLAVDPDPRLPLVALLLALPCIVAAANVVALLCVGGVRSSDPPSALRSE
ncbi:MAG: ABC transporter permease [Actinomycetota bacterium]|nr:ABC transporter permease [Actinomycetota bacterium]